MPLPRFTHAPDANGKSAETPATHYFDAANGDVAELHARIERGFADYSFDEAPFSPAANRIDAMVRLMSRGAGPAGLIGGLILAGYFLF